MAFVVILHLSPDHKSSVSEILQRATRMPVRQVTNALRIEVNHVYVIPPTHYMSMYDGHSSLIPAEKATGRHVAIDLFFQTLADTYRERAVGIVPSGRGSDGSVGLAAIKEQGRRTARPVLIGTEVLCPPRRNPQRQSVSPTHIDGISSLLNRCG